MKRVLKVALAGLVGTAAVAAATPVRELPDAVAAWTAAGDRAAGLEASARLGESQRAATDDIVSCLIDGRYTLAEATAAMESNSQGRPVFLDQLALHRPEGTVRERLAGYVMDRVKERLESDPGRMSAMAARLGAEGK